MSDAPLDVQKAISPEVKTAIDASMKQRATPQTGGHGVFLVNWLANTGDTIAPWWSQIRDSQLRDFWKKVDFLAGAVFTMTAKMTSIPIEVVPKDPTNRKHRRDAEHYTEMLRSAPEFGKGWMTYQSKFVEDLLTQDKGGFALIIADGSPTTPINGRPYTVVNLDAARVQRTGNPTYPIIYNDLDGEQYTYHYTRIMDAAQMPSPNEAMFGTGFCAVSRCINVSQNLLDVLIYKQEKLGSRPHRQIAITSGGLDPEDLQYAFRVAEGALDDAGLSRYSKMIVSGSSTLPQAGLELYDLASLPDGFDEQTAITLGMAAIALAFGTDARELFPAMGGGSTRADALLQHLKQRGKGPGQIIQTTEYLFNNKFLPPHLRLVHDFQDDAEDRQRAEIGNIRATRRRQLILSGEFDMRTSRQVAMKEGDLTELEFQLLELGDGRLEDGSDILVLFYSKQDKEVAKLLNLGLEDPLDVELNDQEMVLRLIHEQMLVVGQYLANAKSVEQRVAGQQAMSALQRLEQVYMNGEHPFVLPEEPEFGDEEEVEGGQLNRLRDKDPTSLTPEELSSDGVATRGERYAVTPSTDDEE